MNIPRTLRSRRTDEVWSLGKRIVLAAIGAIAVVAALIMHAVDRRLDQMELDTGNVIIDLLDSAADENPPPATDRDAEAGPPPVEEEPEDFYVLLIGLDSRENLFLLNTDSLIVAHVIPQTHTVKLLSIPRDQKVILDEEGNAGKINGVFARGYQAAVRAARDNPDLLSGRKIRLGGVEVHEEYVSSGVSLLKRTVERHLGVPISHSFLIHFQSVIELVDKVGGVEVNVDRSMHYTAEFDGTSIHLEPGWQTLDGVNALNYMRHRMDDRGAAYESSDFDRARRQQEVIAALAAKIADWGSLPKALGLLDIITSNVKTDMSRGKMIALITEFYGNLTKESIKSYPYPGEWRYPYVEVIEPDFRLTMDAFRAVDDGAQTKERPVSRSFPAAVHRDFRDRSLFA